MAKEQLKTIRIKSKEFRNQLKEILTGQKWDNMSIHKENKFSGKKHSILNSMEFKMILEKKSF